MQKIKTNDEVVVITGRDKGKRGKITKISGDKVFVSGIQMVKKHQKPNPQAGVPGGIIEKEAAIQMSNIAIFNPATGKADRVGIKILEDKKKIRVFKSNGEAIDA